jgi:hypothetical protein
MNVMMWEHCNFIDSQLLDMAKFTTLILLLLLISCKFIPNRWFENVFPICFGIEIS